MPPVPTLAQAQPTGEPTPPPKQQCSAKKTKWQVKQCQDYNNSAPGDEYFGRMKMSYLGINNTFKDMVVESGEYTTSQQIINKLNFAVEALAKWSAKYPKDPDLARSYYLGVLALRKVYVQAQQELAWQYIQTILKRFPNTYFSKQMALATKDGFTEHWYTDAQPCPVAGADPPPTPTPAPPSKPGQPVVDLMAPPCIAPPTPEPGFAPTATPSPAPRGRNAPGSRGNESTRNARFACEPSADDVRNAERVAFTEGRRRNEESTTGTKGQRHTSSRPLAAASALATSIDRRNEALA